MQFLRLFQNILKEQKISKMVVTNFRLVFLTPQASEHDHYCKMNQDIFGFGWNQYHSTRAASSSAARRNKKKKQNKKIKRDLPVRCSLIGSLFHLYTKGLRAHP